MLVSEPDREDYLKIKDALESLKKFLDRKSLFLGGDTNDSKYPTRGHSIRRHTVRVESEIMMQNPELVRCIIITGLGLITIES